MTVGELYPLVVQDADKPLREAVGSTLADVWQGLVGDKVTAWRMRNAAALNDKLRQAVEKTGSTINLDKVPERIAFAWFEKATESDEPEIQELFAKLLTNAASGNEDALKRRNTQIVADLAPQDAVLLSYLADKFIEFRSSPQSAYRDLIIYDDFVLRNELSERGIGTNEPWDALLSLNVLRLEHEVGIDRREFTRQVEKLSKNKTTWSHELDRVISKREHYVLTTIGESLISALYAVPPKPVVE